MRNIAIFGYGLALVALAGCGSGDATTAGSQSHGKTAVATATSDSLVGKYTAQFEMPEGEEDDPMAKMAMAMAEAFLAGMTLELKDDDTFEMVMMMFPISGTWTRSGDQLTLTPDNIMGMTVDEFREMGEAEGADLDNEKIDKPMTLLVSADGQTLSVVDDSPEQGKLLFIREG